MANVIHKFYVIYKFLNGVTLFGVLDFAWCERVCVHVCVRPLS